MYNAGANHKFIPVLFRKADKRFIPTPLQSATHYMLDREEGYEKLYARLLNRPGVPKPQLVPIRPPNSAEDAPNVKRKNGRRHWIFMVRPRGFVC
jgi:hypothetical protein